MVSGGVAVWLCGGEAVWWSGLWLCGRVAGGCVAEWLCGGVVSGWVVVFNVGCWFFDAGNWLVV